jgi:hypothetical protein
VAVEIVAVGPESHALYLPDGYAVRKMEVGTDWTVLNVGVMFRQSRIANWDTPSALGGRKVGFGLCAGTSAPVGTASVRHFVGVRTASDWVRSQVHYWWSTGWQVFSAAGASETIAASGSGATLRVSERGDGLCSAWYARFSRIGQSQMRVELFLPTGANSPTLFDFEVQLDRAVWKRSVNNHCTYEETAFTVEAKEVILGALDSVNIFSNLHDHVSSQLRGIEWLAVKAVRLE